MKKIVKKPKPGGNNQAKSAAIPNYLAGGGTIVPKPVIPTTLKKSANLWVEYKFNTELGLTEQSNYEHFVCGFLYYYESVLRNDSVDHEIHFDWSANKKGLKIYLSPMEKAKPKYENINTSTNPQTRFKSKKTFNLLTNPTSKDPQEPPPPGH